MKSIFKMMRSMSPKQKLLVKLIGIFFVLCILLVIVIGLFKNRTLSYSELEQKMVTSAKKYYNDYKELLPKEDGGTVSVDSLTLIEQEYMKELTKYNKEAESCSATVTVTNNRDLYLYIPTLKCEKYTTESLYDHILKEQGTVTAGTGLYEYENDYIYRGEYPNNYVTLNGHLYRILRLTGGKEIRLIGVDSYTELDWDNRYNTNSHYNSGITKYEISRIKDRLDKLYTTEFTDESKSYMVSKQLCIGARNKKSTDKTGKAECSVLTKGTYPLGLLQVNEYLLPSLDENCKYQTNSACTNYNFLTKLQNFYWSITPSDENDYEAYYIKNPVALNPASDYYAVRIVLNIDGNINYKSGDGTQEDPYLISKAK